MDYSRCCPQYFYSVVFSNRAAEHSSGSPTIIKITAFPFFSYILHEVQKSDKSVFVLSNSTFTFNSAVPFL